MQGQQFLVLIEARLSIEFFDFWVQASCLHLEIKKHDRKEVESLAAKSFLKDVFIDTL